MSALRLWLQERLARLDETRERKTIAFGAMGLLLILMFGPVALRGTLRGIGLAVDAMSVKTRVARSVPLPAPTLTPFPIASADLPVASASTTAALSPAEPERRTAAPPPPPSLPAPPLVIALPQEDAASGRPVQLAARFQGTGVIDVIFELRGASGSSRGIEASPAGPDGVWEGVFDDDPGSYGMTVRVSLTDGSVHDYPDVRRFRIISADADAVVAPPTALKPAPQVLLVAPSAGAVYQDTAPLTATVKADIPDRIVFIVTAADGGQVLVLGKKWPAGDSWSGIFDGTDGAYRLQARADLGGEEILSDERTFTLKRPKRP